MRADADLSMSGVADILGELIERLDLRKITLVASDWGGPQLLIGGAATSGSHGWCCARARRSRTCRRKARRGCCPTSRAARRHLRGGDAVSLRSPAQAADDVWPPEQAAGPREVMDRGRTGDLTSARLAIQCARVDSNHHGENSPQGPQPCASTNSATSAEQASIAPGRHLRMALVIGGACIRPHAALVYEHMFVLGHSEPEQGAK